MGSIVRTNQQGFSIVEVILASALFAFLVVALGGIIIYGQTSAAGSGDRIRANQLAEEGVEAVRNIRNASYTNLVDGTYGLSQAGNVWSLSGSSDTTGMYTRQVVISSNGNGRKIIRSDVSWPRSNGTASTSITTLLTNWRATLSAPSWNSPAAAGSADAFGSSNGVKVATSGNYAYVLQSTGSSNFVVVNISNPASPTIVSTISLPSIPTNIAVSGNYAYVTTSNNNAELVIVNISNPSAPVQVGTYNATGNAGGLGVYIAGSYAYISRAANSNSDEVVIVNVSNPAAPSRVFGFATNINMNEIYVDSATNVIYASTSSGSQEVIKFTPTLFGMTYVRTNIDLPGTAAATTITGNGSTIYVGQGTSLHAINGSSNAVLGSLTLPGSISDLDLHSSQNYLFAGTNYASGELQVVNNSNLAALSVAGSADLSGASQSLTGVAYNSSLDIVAGTRTANSAETVVFTKN